MNNKKQKLEKGKERDTGDKDEANKDKKDPSDDPNDPSGDQDGIVAGPAIFFNITSKIHLNEKDQNTLQTLTKRELQFEQNAFQTLTMRGKLTIEVFIYLHIHCLIIKFHCRRHQWLGNHLSIRNDLYNSQSFHLAPS